MYSTAGVSGGLLMLDAHLLSNLEATTSVLRKPGSTCSTMCILCITFAALVHVHIHHNEKVQAHPTR